MIQLSVITKFILAWWSSNNCVLKVLGSHPPHVALRVGIFLKGQRQSRFNNLWNPGYQCMNTQSNHNRAVKVDQLAEFLLPALVDLGSNPIIDILEHFSTQIVSEQTVGISGGTT